MCIRDRYEYYNRKDNGQSALLTDVRNILAEEYPDQTVKKDRLVVQIIFKNFYVEVQPVFRQDDDSFKFPESYNGGAWRITKPLHEKAAMTAFSRDKSNNLRKLCKMIRAWKNLHGVNMGGLPVSYTHLDVYKRQPDASRLFATSASILAFFRRPVGIGPISPHALRVGFR